MGEFPTPYPDVNAVLTRLLDGARAALGDQFAALYLYGSLASGDFDPHSSDIDFLVVTAGPLPHDRILALEALHARLWASNLAWAAKLEGAYLPQAALRRYDPDAPACPQVNERRFYVAQQGSDWIIQRHILRACGVVLAGPDPRTLIDPVPPAAVRGAVASILFEWWEPMLGKPAWLRERGPLYHAYAVLTMCRALHTLATGQIASKPVAARWAREGLGGDFPDLIAWAATWRYDTPPDGKDRLRPTLALIRHTVDIARRAAP